MTKHDDFGDRMKAYENVFTSQKVDIKDLLCVRLDGRCFSKITKPLNKPFDHRFIELMRKTTEFMVKETKADFGYVQSDEISLFFSPSEYQNEYQFGGKTSKLNSIFAALASTYFNLQNTIPEMKFAVFDCRTFSVPTFEEMSNVLLWRFNDAKRNSVSSAYRWFLNKTKMPSLEDMKLELKNTGYDWDLLQDFEKFGTFVIPVKNEIDESLPRKLYNSISFDYSLFPFGSRLEFVKGKSNAN